MDYYQGVVADYLRANRAMFLNMECLIQIEPGDTPPKGSSWFCDIVAINLKGKTAHLCEVTFSQSLDALKKRLLAWDSNWARVREALARDCSIPADWRVEPWVFIPSERISTLKRVMAYTQMPVPRITALEDVVLWKYRSWDRVHDAIHELAEQAVGGQLLSTSLLEPASCAVVPPL